MHVVYMAMGCDCSQFTLLHIYYERFNYPYKYPQGGKVLMNNRFGDEAKGYGGIYNHLLYVYMYIHMWLC